MNASDHSMRNSESAAAQDWRIPFSCGSQHFAVYRDGKRILSKDGEPIVDKIELYNFFRASGSASSAHLSPLPRPQTSFFGSTGFFRRTTSTPPCNPD
jgi:hypothetical protein